MLELLDAMSIDELKSLDEKILSRIDSLKNDFDIIFTTGTCVAIKFKNPKHRNKVHAFEIFSLADSIDHCLNCANIKKEYFFQKLNAYNNKNGVA